MIKWIFTLFACIHGFGIYGQMATYDIGLNSQLLIEKQLAKKMIVEEVNTQATEKKFAIEWLRNAVGAYKETKSIAQGTVSLINSAKSAYDMFKRAEGDLDGLFSAKGYSVLFQEIIDRENNEIFRSQRAAIDFNQIYVNKFSRFIDRNGVIDIERAMGQYLDNPYLGYRSLLFDLTYQQNQILSAACHENLKRAESYQRAGEAYDRLARITYQKIGYGTIGADFTRMYESGNRLDVMLGIKGDGVGGLIGSISNSVNSKLDKSGLTQKNLDELKSLYLMQSSKAQQLLQLSSEERAQYFNNCGPKLVIISARQYEMMSSPAGKIKSELGIER